MKIPALRHEIGNVKDMVQGINFDFDKGVARVIDAEVYANQFALEQCVKRGYRQSLILWLDSYRQYVDGDDYRAEVARRTLDGAPTDDAIADWQEFMGDPTLDEVKMIGEKGRRILAGE